MGNCLLFGNGINQCYGAMSWKQLLGRIASHYFVSSNTVTSSTLAFEQLKCAVLSRDEKTDDIGFAFDILKELNNLPQEGYSEVMGLFLNLDIENILTTNFEYNIEKALIPDFQYNSFTSCVVLPQERRCSSLRHTKIGNKSIFHIHGELGKQETVCLGNVHYVDNMIAIMDRILEKVDEDKYQLKNAVFLNDNISWAQFFFRDTVYIVGLGLYECDMDLWWAISYRRKLLLRGDKRINNRIVYYYTYSENTGKNQSFVDCLNAMGVEVREREVSENKWIQAYVDIANDIKNGLVNSENQKKGRTV